MPNFIGSKVALARQNHEHRNIEWGRSYAKLGKMQVQLTSKRSLKLDIVGVSAICGDSRIDGPAE